MNFQKLPEEVNERIGKSRNFQMALQRLQNGKPATPRSWVYEDKDPEWILDTWSQILRDTCARVHCEFISDWDLSKADKFKSQGFVAPFSERLDTLQEYWKHLDYPQEFRSQEWEVAKHLAVKMLGLNKSGQPLSVEAVVERGINEDKYNTSSGDPLFLKRRRPEAKLQAILAAKNGDWKKYYPVLGSRASMGKTGTQARWIFMFPMSVNLVEQRYMYPIMDYIRDRTQKSISSTLGAFFVPWEGYEHVQEIISRYGPRTCLKFGCDYTKMDQHFNIYHAFEVYDVVKNYFRPEFWHGLRDSISYTFNCPVITSDGMLLGPHAMPSGSGWTNFLETMFNLIVAIYIRLKWYIPVDQAMGIGDDQLWFIRGKYTERDSVKLTNVVTNVFLKLGLDANPSKQEVSSHVAAFLQRRSYEEWSGFHNTVPYAGVYPTIRALTSEVFPEFYHNESQWDSKTFALRCLMILENCHEHPAFEQFCIFIAEGNSNIQEFVQSADSEILLTRRKARSIANFLPTYNQAKLKENILSFQSLILLRRYYNRKK